jgi:hypothetical protein
MNESPLIDNGGYPVIVAHDVADMHLLGSKVRMILFDWFKVAGVWQRHVVGAVERPVDNMQPELIKQWAHALADRPPSEPVPITGVLQ